MREVLHRPRARVVACQMEMSSQGRWMTMAPQLQRLTRLAALISHAPKCGSGKAVITAGLIYALYSVYMV